MELNTGTEMTQIKCAKCKCTLQRFAGPDAQDYFACPNCSSGDTLDNIVRGIGEQAAEYATERLEAAFAKGARSSKYLKFKPSRRSKKMHRFIIDLDR